MKIENVNQFKEELKGAVQDWGNSKIDELFSNSVSRTFAKNGLNNALTRYDAQMNKGIELLWMFVSDDKGVVDSSTMIDNVNAMLKEMEQKEYDMGGFKLLVGNGEVGIELPKNIFLDMLVGCSKLRFTSGDINEFKNLLI